MKKLLLIIPVFIAIILALSSDARPFVCENEQQAAYINEAVAQILPEDADLSGGITEKGKALSSFLDRLDVEKYWLPGKDINWMTGEIKSGKDSSTHCSAFAAAVSYKLGIYLLRPPEHSLVLLANAQQNWLKSNGNKNGWIEVRDYTTAQALANKGVLVVASYKSTNISKPGHIAVVRPYVKSLSELSEEGPQIIQAGSANYNSTSLKAGFKGHPKAWEDRQIFLYSHETGEIPSVFN